MFNIIFIIVGFKKVIAKKDGSIYYELHCVSDDKFVTGQRCDSFFVPESVISDSNSFSVGSPCSITFNRYGRVDEVVL